MFTKKQLEVLECAWDENPKILICSGAKRSGKTFVLTYIFLGHIARYRNMGLSFILGGATQGSLRRNVLSDMEDILGKELRLDRSNSVEIFGNRVYCFDGQNSDSWKRVRGFTAAGAFMNEGTALHNDFVKEVISRCSYPGARIYIDTNPENPVHSIKKDYIDHNGERLKNGLINVRAFHFTLFDNTTLSDEYVQSIIASTPSGMYTDRDIYGRWVGAEGLVYPDFSDKLYINSLDGLSFTSYFAGVDWGYEHFGAVTVFGECADGTVVMIEQHAKQHEEIEYWVDIAKGIKERWGDIPFYCDSARPEHIKRFKREGLRAKNADKAVLSGIEQVARRFKQGTLKIYKNGDRKTRFEDEIYMYAWNERTGEPVKLYNDVLDSMRYAIYTHYGKTPVKTAKWSEVFGNGYR